MSSAPEMTATSRTTVPLTGTALTPLGRYLKALALLRLVAEQVDPGATGAWQAGAFHLTSTADGDGLVEFLLHRYTPTPLVSPWNNGSGFGAKDATSSKAAVAAVDMIAGADIPRLASYRETIAAARAMADRPGWYELTKEEQVALCRNELPDVALEWIDAAVVLTSESRSFPPLLGTGGNDGRFDFTSNYMQRLATVLELEPRKRKQTAVADLAHISLFEGEPLALDDMVVGQFDPAGAGGPAATPFGPAGSIGNPWDFVLLLEGALLFASGAARRLSSSHPNASVPFAVGVTRAGHATAALDEKARGELWAPLWERPLGLPELRELLGEGRAEYRGRQADTGLDLARAIASLGVDRGISGFVRHVFLERNGLATFAVPIGYHQVNAVDGVRVLGQLDNWASGIRRTVGAPASIASAVQRLEQAQFAACARNSTEARQQVLIEAASIERLAARSSGLRERAGKLRLPAADWIPIIEDGSDEFAVALALASLRGTRSASRGWLADLFFNPKQPHRPGRVRGADVRALPKLLADCAIELAITPPSDLRRLVAPNPTSGDVTDPPPGPQDGAAAKTANRRHAQALLDRRLDEERLRDLLGALSLLDWSWWPEQTPPPETSTASPSLAAAASPERRPADPPTTALALLAPLYTRRAWPSAYRAHRVVAPNSWLRRLAAGQVAAVCSEAMRQYRIAGLDLLVADADRIAAGVDGAALAAACFLPLNSRSTLEFLDHIARRPAPGELMLVAAASNQPHSQTESGE